MSRSFKKTPIAKDNQGRSHELKKLASRRYRRASLEEQESTPYKYHTNSWEIHDYVSRWTKKDAIQAWREEGRDGYYHKKYGSLRNFLNKCWYKYYRRK